MDGSCHIHLGKQVTGGGADLAAVTAAILQGQPHIAIDSLYSLFQNRKQTQYPELHCQHVRGNILKIIIQLVRNSPTPFYLYKVESHAGTASNECADAIAKHQAIQGNDTIFFPLQQPRT
eukprot:1152584-Pelagomonas_calceolata.AAC.3